MILEEACHNFRTYLESSGVSEILLSTLKTLAEMRHKPHNPVEWIRQNLPPVQEETIDTLTRELKELQKDLDTLRSMLTQNKIPKPTDIGVEKEPEQKNLEGDESGTKV